MANLEAAKVCNHKRTISKNWKSSLEKKKIRLTVLKKRARDAQTKIKKRIKDWDKKHEERMVRHEDRLKAAEAKLEEIKLKMEKTKSENKDVSRLNKRVKRKRELVKRQKQRIRDTKTKQAIRMEKLKQRLENRKQRDAAALEKMKLRISVQKETRDYNISTSLKSYIDPRIYHEWGRQVAYDWKKYYPKSLHNKFSWLDCQDKKS